jgi:hypothetical protein
MHLPVESLLGPYRIVGLIGSGGLGEVYRARDSRLHRDVAIKVVPGSGSDGVRDVEFEARAVSALNHPNILTVYDVGRQDRSAYIVSEFVDGESLRSILKRGALPFEKVLDHGEQIAAGLAAAHAAGIVHRDLKPENIMVTRAGRVKILDFGLAKPVAAGALDGSIGNDATAPGILIGTAAYMSPEQARGRDVRHYSDQFALGMILFEMATGRNPFRRETPLDTLSAILSEPAPEVPAGPFPFRWLVMRCLHKEPDHRYSSTDDIAKELANIRRMEERQPETPLVVAEPASAAVEGNKWRVTPKGVLHSLILAAVGVAGFGLGQARITEPRAFSTSDVVWSADGRSMAWAERGELFVRTDGAEARRVAVCSTSCSTPFWSGDGERVYWVADRVLWSSAASGGAPERVLADVIRATAGPDGRLAALRPGRGGRASLWVGLPHALEQVTADVSREAELDFARDGVLLVSQHD